MEKTYGMILIVYGYDGSGPGHWQRWLEAELHARGAAVMFPELPDPAAPQKDAWVAALAEAMAAAHGDSVTFVCHSLGCWAVDHLLAERSPLAAYAALLVSPPSPYLLFEPVETFLPPPRRPQTWAPLAARTLVVGSDNDEFTSAEEFQDIADSLGVQCRIIPGAGHITIAAGFGPWPFALEWLEAVGAL